MLTIAIALGLVSALVMFLLLAMITRAFTTAQIGKWFGFVKKPVVAGSVIVYAIMAMAAATQIDLAHQVFGVLGTSNGGTGVTGASTGSVGVVLSTSPTITTPTLSSPTITGTLGAILDVGTSQAVALDIANAGTTGTTVNKLAKLTGAPSTAVITATSDTSGIAGIVTAGAGTTGNAQITQEGYATCVFDGATTAGDYVQNSSTTAGDCHDFGAGLPTSGQIIGRITSTNASAGSFVVFLFGPAVQGSTAINFADNETPSGTINGSNTTFTLAHTPASTGNVNLFLNGVQQRQGGSNDYTISGSTITYNTAPATGDTLNAFYRF